MNNGVLDYLLIKYKVNKGQSVEIPRSNSDQIDIDNLTYLWYILYSGYFSATILLISEHIYNNLRSP